MQRGPFAGRAGRRYIPVASGHSASNRRDAGSRGRPGHRLDGHSRAGRRTSAQHARLQGTGRGAYRPVVEPTAGPVRRTA